LGVMPSVFGDAQQAGAPNVGRDVVRRGGPWYQFRSRDHSSGATFRP